MESIKTLLIQHDVDLLCVQECDMYDAFWKASWAALGYTSIYQKKTNTKQDGVGIVFDPTKYSIETTDSIPLNDITTSDPELQGRLQRDNVALFVRFRHQATKQTFVIATTHLFWDPAQEDVKLAQTQYVLKQLNRFNVHNDPVIFAGDFNSLPQSAVYTAIVESGLRSVHGQAEPEFTNFTATFHGTLDYIWYSSK